MRPSLLLSAQSDSLAACWSSLSQQICKHSAVPLRLNAGVSTRGEAARLLLLRGGVIAFGAPVGTAVTSGPAQIPACACDALGSWLGF